MSPLSQFARSTSGYVPTHQGLSVGWLAGTLAGMAVAFSAQPAVACEAWNECTGQTSGCDPGCSWVIHHETSCGQWSECVPWC
jgi:hypothetical protein